MPLDGTTGAEGASPDLGSIDVDGLMAQIESGQDTNVATPATPVADASDSTSGASAPRAAPELEFTWNGKQIKAPYSDPRIKQWASQGYDYAQRMAEFNRQQTEFQTKSQRVQEYESRYKPVEEYIEKNPQWWEHVNSQWQALQGTQPGLGSDPNNPVLQKLTAYEQKLSQIEQFIQSAQAEKRAEFESKENDARTKEIQSIRESYSDLEWNAPDEAGLNLELKVLKHAQAIGTNSFRAAFRDFFHDELTKRASEAAKESVVKERQKQTKLGLLGKSQSPKAGITAPSDIKNQSYEELIQEGLKELGIA